MTTEDRIIAFAKLLGFSAPLFSNVSDAEAFILLTKDNTVMKQFPLYIEYVKDKVLVSADAYDGAITSESTKLTWCDLTKYNIDNATGTVTKV